MAVAWADPALVAAAAEQWTQGQFECRVMRRHAWTLRMTMATRLRNGNMQLRQQCSRRCGVSHIADFNQTGYQLSRWRMDYSEAKSYLLRDSDGRTVGRIDPDGMASLWRIALQNRVRIVEVPDE